MRIHSILSAGRHAPGLLACGVLIVGATVPAVAEQRFQTIEEVIVTAQKRSESVGDVPIAMAVLGSDELGFKGIRSAQDLQIEVPGLRSGTHAGTTQVSIRGIGLGLFYGPAQPGVAQYIDGAYLPRATSGNLLQTDLERIEVLKGPQGTLYGRNSTGGAINYITRAPTEELEGTFSLGYGSYDEWRGSAALSGAVTDRLSLRGAISVVDRTEGQMDRVLNGLSSREVDPMQDISARLRGSYAFSDRVTIDTTLFFSQSQGGNYLQNTTAYSDLAISQQPILGTAINSTRPFRIGQTPGRYEKDAYGAVLTVTGDLTDTLSLRSVTSLSRTKMTLTVDIDASEIEFLTGAHEDESTFFSQELNLSGSNGGFDWITGLYYSFDQLEGAFWDDFPNGFNGGIFEIFDGGQLKFRWEPEMTSYAVFFDTTYEISDRLQAFGGLRYSVDEYAMETFNTMNNVSFFGGPVADVAVNCGPQTFREDFEKLSSRIGLRYDTSDTGIVYGSWSTSYKPGGFEFTACGDPFDEETITSFEIGYKGTLLDGLASINLAAFYYDYSDYQLYSTQGLAALTSNADSAEVYGLEFDGSYLVTDALKLTAAVALLRARWDEFSNFDPLNPDAGTQDVSDEPLPFSPDWTANLGLEYRGRIPNADVLVRGEYYLSADYNLREFGARLDAQKEFEIINAYVEIDFDSSNYRLRLWGRNLTDEAYITTMNSHGLSGTRAVTYGDRRMVGIDFTYDL